jgi:4-amino-4-deoxy-L-arabinose transferase-like glycosyltransferase
LTWLAAGVCSTWFLLLPLRDVLAYPGRLAVLPNLETDAAAYDAFARDFASSWQLSALPAKHPPGWVVILAITNAVAGHSFVAGKLVSWAALIISVALCGWLANRVYGDTAAAIAVVLCASSPGLRGYVGTLQYEVVTAALFTLLLAAGTRVVYSTNRRDGLLRRAAFAGAAGAALVLTRETFVLVVPIVAWWIWRRRALTGGGRDGALAALILVGLAATPAVIWSAAQTAHYQRLILISEKGPKEFQLGNNPLANGTYNEPLAGMAEPSGFAFVRAYPLKTLQLAARKVLYFFGALRDGWNVPQPAAVWLWRATTGVVPLSVIMPIVSGGWLLVAFAAALYCLGRDGLRLWWVLPAAVGAILAVHVITIASFRFAVPVLPVLYVLASGPLALLCRATLPLLRTPALTVAALIIAALAVAGQFRSWPLQAGYDAVDLDGVAAANAVDPVSGSPVRVADARRGERPVVLLTDTYLPRGPLTVTVQMRAPDGVAAGSRAVARVALLHLNGDPACVADVSAAQTLRDRFSDVVIPCRLARDGPATLAVYTLARADLAIDRVLLRWSQ